MAKYKLTIKNRIVPRPPSSNTEGPVQEQISEEEANKHQVYSARQYFYKSLQSQLDMLWHDIDEGKIQADTTSANTWYGHIKTIKEAYPLLAVSANTTSS